MAEDFDNLMKAYFVESKRDRRLDIEHPDEEQLFDYAAGLLKKRAHDAIEQHLADCPFCLNLFRQQKSLFGAVDKISSEDSVAEAKRNLKQLLGHEHLAETIIGLGSGITQLVKTTGTPAPEILSASRGTSSLFFDSSGSVDHYLGGYRITITVERYDAGQAVHVTVVDPAQDEFPENISVILENGKKEEALTHEGDVSFGNVPAGRHLLRFVENESDLGSIFLELRELSVPECLVEARVALKQGAYSKAEDFVTTALSREESDEALELMLVLQLLKEIYPQGFQDDLATRSLEPQTQRMVDSSLTNFDTLSTRVESYNRMLAEASRELKRLAHGETTDALNKFRMIAQKVPDSEVGYVGVGLALQYGRSLAQLSSNELQEVVDCFYTALKYKPHIPEYQEHYNRAVHAKKKKEPPPPSDGLEDRTFVQLTLSLLELRKQLPKFAADEFDMQENRLKLFLKDLNEIKARQALPVIENVSEAELHRHSNDYNFEVTGRVKALKTLLSEEFLETQTRLIAEIGGEESWQKLDVSGLYLLTGEFVFELLKQTDAEDYSPASLGFVKALETLLNQKIFWQVASWLGCPPRDLGCVGQNLKGDFDKAEARSKAKGKRRVFIPIILENAGKLFSRTYALSCGEMAGTVRDLKTRHKDWKVYQSLRNFLSDTSEHFLEESFQEVLGQVSEYRNGAVHNKALSLEEMERCRKLIIPEIKFLLTVF